MSVSIWEGQKAQDLIDAINSGGKVDRQQGALNAGRSLVVGADGVVVPGYVVLPDNVKNALMNCFMHVTWKDDKGEEYGEALRTALYETNIESHVIFNLPALQDTKCFSMITNTPVREKTEESTVIIKCKWSGEEITNDVSTCIVLDGRSDTFLVAQRMQCAYNKANNTVVFRNSYLNVGGNTVAHTASDELDVVFIQRTASNGLVTLKTYVNGSLEYSYANTPVSSMVFAGNYAIGNNHTIENKAFNGTYSLIKIYDIALTDEEIDALLEGTV